MASNLKASDLVKSSWDFFSKKLNKLWPLALVFALPAILGAFSNSRSNQLKGNFDNFSDWSSYTETTFGVSLATIGVAVVLFLVVAAIYTAIVYSGGIKLVLDSLRGKAADFSPGEIFGAGIGYLGKFIVLSIFGGAIVVAGFILLVVPGLIALFFISLAWFFMVDKNMDAGESLSASYKTVKANAGSVFSVYVLMFLITIAASIVSTSVFGADVWVIRVLEAAFQGFVSLFSLIVGAKLYLALMDSKPHKPAHDA